MGHTQTLQHRPAPPSPVAAPEIPQQTTPPENREIPTGTSLQVEASRSYPMRAGESIDARLLHPIYADGKLVVPENTELRGTVIALDRDTKSRWHARLRGDFTPFHTAEVRFDEMVLDGTTLRIEASNAIGGAPVVHLSTTGAAPHRSFLAKEWSQAKASLHERIAYITAPGKGDRALRLLYHQLPYHPERIEAHTAWSFELKSPLDVPNSSIAAAPPPQPATPPGKPEIWDVHALLIHDLSSASARPGDSVQALVVEPVYDKNKQLVVPQGATLVGKVTSASAARSFGRNGKLRFTFQQVQFPEGFNRPVEGSLAGATTEKNRNLSLDAEGTISPKNQSSAIAPLLLTLLAGRALDEDGNLTVNNGVASNGFGLVGRIVGLAAGNRNLAAGLGYYAASLSLYENFLHPGRDVLFPRDTRIEIETTPLRAPVLAPEGQ
jgi:hypothetical protein